MTEQENMVAALAETVATALPESARRRPRRRPPLPRP